MKRYYITFVARRNSIPFDSIIFHDAVVDVPFDIDEEIAKCKSGETNKVIDRILETESIKAIMSFNKSFSATNILSWRNYWYIEIITEKAK